MLQVSEHNNVNLHQRSTYCQPSARSIADIPCINSPRFATDSTGSCFHLQIEIEDDISDISWAVIFSAIVFN